MVHACYSATAPGKLMLTGEHAVLHGRRALVGAVDQRLRVSLRPWRGSDADARTVRIHSSLGDYSTTLDDLTPRPPFRFILHALTAAHAARSGGLPGGLELTVESDFTATVGLGSSAAVTVATVAALHAWCADADANASPAGENRGDDRGNPNNGFEIDQVAGRDNVAFRAAVFRDALATVRAVQGRASGADVAASVYGGVLLYAVGPDANAAPGITPLPGLFPLTVRYSGGKLGTSDAITLVEERRVRQPALFDALFDAMDGCTVAAVDALGDGDLPRLGAALDAHHGLHEAIGACNAQLAAMVHALRAVPGIHGAKISGSGLGDCVIAVGTPGDGAALALANVPGDAVPVQLSPRGVEVDVGTDAPAISPIPIVSATPSVPTAPAIPTRQMLVARVLAGRTREPVRDVGTAFAPANIALVKYWGKRQADLNLPVTGSLSVSLGQLGTTTHVRVIDGPDTYSLNHAPVPPDSGFARRLRGYLDLVRPSAATGYAVETHNSIPTAAGLASSASGFAALVQALDALYGWQLPLATRSALARLGSGSACRSLAHGFVRWHAGTATDGMDSIGESLPVAWPEFRIGLLTLSSAGKPLGSREAMNRTTATSALYSAWPGLVERDLARAEAAIAARDLATLGSVAEQNALSMHATMIAAWPPVLYWLPESVATIHRVHQLRAAGVMVYLTMDAGPNVKLLFSALDEAKLQAEFPTLCTVMPFSSGLSV